MPINSLLFRACILNLKIFLSICVSKIFHYLWEWLTGGRVYFGPQFLRWTSSMFLCPWWDRPTGRGKSRWHLPRLPPHQWHTSSNQVLPSAVLTHSINGRNLWLGQGPYVSGNNLAHTKSYALQFETSLGPVKLLKSAQVISIYNPVLAWFQKFLNLEIWHPSFLSALFITHPLSLECCLVLCLSGAWAVSISVRSLWLAVRGAAHIVTLCDSAIALHF